jgi:hypothetical protein
MHCERPYMNFREFVTHTNFSYGMPLDHRIEPIKFHWNLNMSSHLILFYFYFEKSNGITPYLSPLTVLNFENSCVYFPCTVQRYLLQNFCVLKYYKIHTI